MGDSTTNVSSAPEEPEAAEPQQEATSKEILRESKPSPNISIKAPPAPESETTVPPAPSEPLPTQPSGPAKIETVFEKLDMASDRSDSTTDSVESAKSKSEDMPPPETPATAATPPNIPPSTNSADRRSSAKNRSTIFDSPDKDSADTIFSVKGTPSGRLNRRRDMCSTVFPVGCMGCRESTVVEPQEAAASPRGKPSDGEDHQMPRNPLTGVGVGYTDEVRKSCRRKDGNPIMGTGYESEMMHSSSSNRIPPGGYSKGLW